MIYLDNIVINININYLYNILIIFSDFLDNTLQLLPGTAIPFKQEHLEPGTHKPLSLT